MIYLRRLRSYLTDLSFLCLLSVAFKASFSLFGILCFFSNAINSDSKAASSFTGAGILKLRYPYIMLFEMLNEMLFGLTLHLVLISKQKSGIIF